MIKLSDYVMEYIAGLGVKNIFMLPGGGCMHLVDSLGRNKKSSRNIKKVNSKFLYIFALGKLGKESSVINN